MTFYDPHRPSEPHHQGHPQGYDAERDINIASRDNNHIGHDKISYVNQGDWLGYGDKITGGKVRVSKKIFNGNPWAIATVSIVLVAMFLILIWTMLPSVRQFIQPSAQSVATPSPQPAATALETLDYFCHAVSAHAFDEAYQVYSDGLQQQVSPSQFQKQWNKSYSSCVPTGQETDANTTYGTVSFLDFFSKQTIEYNVTLVRNKYGYWRIDSMQQQ